MTVGVGLLCSDGIVLCADRQITLANESKYEERKIFKYHGTLFSLTFTYAGIPDEAAVMFRRICEALENSDEETNAFHAHDRARAILERVFKEGFQNDYQSPFQTLIGFCFQYDPPWLFRTWDSSVVDGYLEYIGTGETSALRYLASTLIDKWHIPSVKDATILGSYIISVANRYVDKCSGGPDNAVMSGKGRISEGGGGPYANALERFFYCEEQAGRALRELLISGGTKKATVEDIK